MNRFSTTTLLALALVAPAFAGANLTKRAAEARGAIVSDVSYKLHLELREKVKTYDGDVLVRFKLARVPSKLHLDFQGEVLKLVEVNGQALTGITIGEDGKVWIPGPSLKAGRNRIHIQYTNDYDTDGAGLHKLTDSADGREYIYTDFEPYDANRLFPAFDQPDLKASYHLSVSAPPTWTVVGNGREVSNMVEGDLVRHQFARTERFSTYIMAVCAGPFASWTDAKSRIPSRVLCVQSMAEHMDAGRIFKITRQGFDFFEKYFDIPYPFHKYDQIFLPQFNSGAMENVAAVTFNGRMIYRHKATRADLQGRANTILHEMAHMWFGDIVTMQWWNDLWLNESFATYMANLALVEATEYTESWRLFTKGTKSWAYWQDQLPTTHPIETEVPDTETTFTNFDGITYGKGASVLKQLAYFVGEDAFRKGTSNYLKKFAFKNARRKDFMDSIAAAAGRDLDGWTDEWIKKSGVNTLVARMETGKKGKIKRFYLDQGKGNGDGVLRTHRVKVSFFRRKKGKLVRAESAVIEAKGASTRIKRLERKTKPDFVLVNDGAHAYAKVFLDKDSLAFAQKHLDELPGDVRASVWNTVWFMVRDGLTPPQTYVDLFLAKAPLEDDVGLLKGFRWSIGDAIGAYLTPEDRKIYMKRLYKVASDMVESSKPGGDIQRTWFGFQITGTEHPESLTHMVALLDGKASIRGLKIDSDLRWKMIAKLARNGHPAMARLRDAEAAKDPGDRSKKALVSLTGAAPGAANKLAIWSRFLQDKDTPLDHLKAGMRNFFHSTQTADTALFVDRYFEKLPELLKTRDTYFVRAFVGGLFPGKGHKEASVLEKSRALLKKHDKDFPYFLKRSLIESNDELERALRIRSAR